MYISSQKGELNLLCIFIWVQLKCINKINKEKKSYSLLMECNSINDFTRMFDIFFKFEMS